jgi:deoxyhypusine synthase
MISSGVREQILWLTKHKHVNILTTSAGGVEEDVLKCRMPFRVGSFAPSGEILYDAGVCRIGNIYATTEHYAYLEIFLQKIFAELYDEQKKTGKASTPSQLIRLMGKHIETDGQFDYQKSYLYWAYKNDIPVFCPGIVDGAIGDMLYFYKKVKKDFVLDVTGDHEKIIDIVLNAEKTGAILLGGGISKHYVLNANIFREGLDYTVYITTAQESDGSDSGGSPDEAVTWSKIQARSPRVKVVCDASIAFPILVHGAFVKK